MEVEIYILGLLPDEWEVYAVPWRRKFKDRSLTAREKSGGSSMHVRPCSLELFTWPCEEKERPKKRANRDVTLCPRTPQREAYTGPCLGG